MSCPITYIDSLPVQHLSLRTKPDHRLVPFCILKPFRSTEKKEVYVTLQLRQQQFVFSLSHTRVEELEHTTLAAAWSILIIVAAVSVGPYHVMEDRIALRMLEIDGTLSWHYIPHGRE